MLSALTSARLISNDLCGPFCFCLLASVHSACRPVEGPRLSLALPAAVSRFLQQHSCGSCTFGGFARTAHLTASCRDETIKLNSQGSQTVSAGRYRFSAMPMISWCTCQHRTDAELFLAREGRAQGPPCSESIWQCCAHCTPHLRTFAPHVLRRLSHQWCQRRQPGRKLWMKGLRGTRRAGTGARTLGLASRHLFGAPAQIAAC